MKMKMEMRWDENGMQNKMNACMNEWWWLCAQNEMKRNWNAKWNEREREREKAKEEEGGKDREREKEEEEEELYI